MKNCLRSDRIFLRAPEPADTDFCYEVENDVSEWETTENYLPVSRLAIETFIRNYLPDPLNTRQVRFIITERSRQCQVGMADLFDIDLLQGRAGVGIFISRKARRRGYALEALAMLSAYARTHLGLRLLYAHIFAENLPSRRLFQKEGYTESGLLGCWFRRGPRVSDAVVMLKKL